MCGLSFIVEQNVSNFLATNYTTFVNDWSLFRGFLPSKSNMDMLLMTFFGNYTWKILSVKTEKSILASTKEATRDANFGLVAI